MYFTNPTTMTAVAIVAMAVSQFPSIMVAAAPVARSQADDLFNGQLAQKLNRQFQAVTVEDSCTAGDTGCIAGHFATCSQENDWEVSPCPKNMKCFAVPGAGKTSTSTLCTTQDDALARIKDTGAKGGINGDDTSDDNNNNGGGGGDEGSSTTAATTTTADVSSTPTAPPTVTSAPASSDIAKFSIPVGDDLSSILASITTTASTEEITSTPDSTRSDSTTTLPTATSTPALSDIPAFSLPIGQDLTAVLPTQSTSDTPCETSDAATSTESVVLVTTTVTVPPTDCATTGVPETSAAQGSASRSNYVTFTTHSFSPIPISTPASTSDTLTSTAGGYLTVSSSSSEAPLITTSSTSSASLVFVSGTTVGTPDYPSEAVPSSTTGSVSTSSGDPSIPPLAPPPAAPTEPVSVLPIHTIPA